MKSYREISAGVVVFRKERGGIKFLLLYHGAGYWNFPKGRLNKGESEIDGALRELNEETGLKSKDLVLDKKFKITEKYFFRRGKNPIFKIAVFFLAQAKTEKITLSWEHDGFGWFSYKDAVKMLKYKGTKKTLTEAAKYLNI